MTIALPIEPICGAEIEGRADLVVDDRRPEFLECPENPWQMFVHPGGALGPRHTGYANGPVFTEIGKPFSGGWVEKQNGRQSGEGHHLHDRGRSGVVIAIERQEEAIG